MESVSIEVQAIIPRLFWTRAFTVYWKAKEAPVDGKCLHIMSDTMALELIIKKGFYNGFSCVDIPYQRIAAAIGKERRHSDRALLIRLPKIDAISIATNIQLLHIQCLEVAFT